jgi:hypothetical protein
MVVAAGEIANREWQSEIAKSQIGKSEIANRKFRAGEFCADFPQK